MMKRWLAALGALPALLCGAGPVRAQSILDACVAETCKARLTADQLLGEIQTLIVAKRYAEAKPMLAALSSVPSMKLESRFLSGYVAQQTGDLKTAEALFRQILVDDPAQTRVRLELGRTLLAMGRSASADHQLKMVEEDEELPPEIARTVRSVRSAIRSKRAWTLNMDVGFAPDSNINNATAVDTVTVLFGNQPIPLTLDDRAKAKSGTGVTGSVDAGLRLPIADQTSLLVDMDAFGTEYEGRDYDDISVEAAVGPEFALTEALRFRAEGLAAQRNFGGRVASRQFGVKSGFEATLGRINRIGLQVDARRTTARFDRNYDGYQVGVHATYERVVGKALVASTSLFVRRDWLRADAYSSTELGGLIGFGGELPAGFNLGLSGGVSHAEYDAAIAFFSPDPRGDWRFNARATLGNRGVRVMGFSPSFSLSYGRNDSSIDYYATERTRFRFALARYF